MATEEQKKALDEALLMAMFGETPESIEKALKEAQAKKEKSSEQKTAPTK